MINMEIRNDQNQWYTQNWLYYMNLVAFYAFSGSACLCHMEALHSEGNNLILFEDQALSSRYQFWIPKNWDYLQKKPHSKDYSVRMSDLNHGSSKIALVSFPLMQNVGAIHATAFEFLLCIHTYDLLYTSGWQPFPGSGLEWPSLNGVDGSALGPGCYHHCCFLPQPWGSAHHCHFSLPALHLHLYFVIHGLLHVRQGVLSALAPSEPQIFGHFTCSGMYLPTVMPILVCL